MAETGAGSLPARTLLDQLGGLVSLLDRKGTVVEANRRVVTIAGRRDDVVGHPIWAAPWWSISTSMQDELRAAVEHAAGGEDVRVEVPAFVGPHRRSRLVLDLTIRPVGGTVTAGGLLIVEARDVTEEKQVEAQIARQNAELADLNSRLQERDITRRAAFANASHELRAPLSVILTGAERLLRLEGLNDEQRLGLATARTQALVALKHVNDLLDAARLEQSRVDLRLADGDLAELVRSVASDFAPLVERRRQEYRIETPERLPARFDADKVTSVLTNFLSNAIKFTPPGGVVRCTLAQADGRIRLEVADSGPGIPAARRGEVFGRFNQTDERAAPIGSGLGLAIAAQFAELHGGTVSAGDAKEGGALLSAELPHLEPEGSSGGRSLAHEAAARLRRELAVDMLAAELAADRRAAQRISSSSHMPERSTVLIVGSDPSTVALLVALLGDRYRVVAVYDADDVVEQARTQDADVLVADVSAEAVADGRLLRRLREDAELQELPVLVVTDGWQREQRVMLLRSGAQDALHKPLQPEEVLARVGTLARLSQLQRRANELEIASWQPDDREQAAIPR